MSGMFNMNWRGSVVFDGKLFGIPHNHDQLLVFDPVSLDISGLSVPSELVGNQRQWQGGAVLEGKLYGIPASSKYLLEYSPPTESPSMTPSISPSESPSQNPTKGPTSTCNGYPDPAGCVLQHGNCDDPIVGRSVKSNCPAMCETCSAFTCNGEPDPVACNIQYGNCDDPIFGEFVRSNCPAMCGACTVSPLVEADSGGQGSKGDNKANGGEPVAEEPAATTTSARNEEPANDPTTSQCPCVGSDTGGSDLPKGAFFAVAATVVGAIM